MPEWIVKYRDYKPEKGTMRFKSDTAFDEALFRSNVAGMSYCGFYEVAEVITTPFTTPTLPTGSTAIVNSDKDFKCLLTFKYTPTGEFKRVAIPAPKINTTDGINMKAGEKRMFVPAVKDTGALGSDGNTLATLIAAAYGYATGSLIFMSGHTNKMI